MGDHAAGPYHKMPAPPPPPPAGCPVNHEGEEHLTSVYRSCDDGRTWRSVTHIANAFWSSLFMLGGAVYLIGATQQYGSIVIRRSEDSGNTWTHPGDSRSGLLFRGGPRRAGTSWRPLL